MSLKCPTNFSWIIEGLLAGCAYPSHGGHFRFLITEGIKHLVTLTEYVPPPHIIPEGELIGLWSFIQLFCQSVL